MEAFLQATAVDIELADGDLASARATLRRAADAAEYSSDGPIAALVAAAAARLALATGDPTAAATAIGVSIRRRGAPDLGDVEAVATRAAVTAALGAEAEAAIEAGRALDVASGMAMVRMIGAQTSG